MFLSHMFLSKISVSISRYLAPDFSPHRAGENQGEGLIRYYTQF